MTKAQKRGHGEALRLRARSAGRVEGRRDASRRLPEGLLCASRLPTRMSPTTGRPWRSSANRLSAGKVAAAVALERALRDEDHGDFDNDLARILAD